MQALLYRNVHSRSSTTCTYCHNTAVLTGCVCCAGAGVAVGSGIGFAVMAAAEEEAKAKAGGAAPIAAASVVEKKNGPGRGFAASN